MLSLRAAALTDIGRIRHENEDRFLLNETSRFFGIADGVGGLPGGAEAAQGAVDEIEAGLLARPMDDEPDLATLTRAANDAVVALGRKISSAMGIGTTLTFGCIQKDTMLIGHVGDSRCYTTRQGEFIRLTEDHSVENDARRARERGEVAYYHESNRNALTRCIGQPTPLEVDVIRRPLAAGDRFLFCTDGVTRLIPESELASLLTKYEDPDSTVKDMVMLAVRRGGPDNATAVAVFIDSV